MKRITQLSLILLVAVSCIVGCGDSESMVLEQIKEGNTTQIQRLRNCYTMYLEINQYKGPKDKAELLDFLTTDEEAILRRERMGIADDELEAMFVSQRDNQPFIVRWGLEGVADHAMVFETTGIEGKRLVALGQPREMAAAEYDDYFSGKVKPLGPTTDDTDADIPDGPETK